MKHTLLPSCVREPAPWVPAVVHSGPAPGAARGSVSAPGLCIALAPFEAITMEAIPG